MNRKLRKLIRDPKAFFRDMHALQPVRARLSRQAGKAELVNPKSNEAVPLDISVAGLELFDLLGDNWLEDNEEPKPIAIIWGFHPWKREFTTRYLPEYRVAFARGRTPWLRQRAALDGLNGLTFVVWGMTEPAEVLEYATQREIPLFRMEDGFIRSAELGAAHTTPLSLVLDRTGLYFDATRPSGLEDLLNNYDFEGSTSLMREAQSLLEVLRALKVSKYNLGAIESASALLGAKYRKRVLVLGQVEQDAAIRFGLGHQWNSLRLIELARAENPGAEILYRPHPEVVRSYRSNSTDLEKMRTLCRVVAEDVALADLFGSMDRVYTISSLSGFEALIHGLPVTVVGAPFYAGWGLTDDRVPIERRSRTLTVTQLFCAAYLLYPRYLPNLNDPVRGCLAAMLRVTAQRRARMNGVVNAKFVVSKASRVAASAYWPQLLKKEVLSELVKDHGKKLLPLFQLQRIFGICPGTHYQLAVACMLTGKLRDTPAYGKLLSSLKSSMRPDSFAKIITNLWQMKPSADLLDHWAWYCERTGKETEARAAISYAAVTDRYPVGTDTAIAVSRYPFVLRLAQLDLRQRRLDEAFDAFLRLLLSGYANADTLSAIAEIAKLRFDMRSSTAIYDLMNHFEPDWKQGRGYIAHSIAAGLSGHAGDALRSIASACYLNPQAVESTYYIDQPVAREFGELPLAEALHDASEVEEGTLSAIGRAKALVVAGRAAEAEKVLLAYQPTAGEMVKFSLALSLAYSYQGKLQQAKSLIASLLPANPSVLYFREGLRLSVLMNDYEWGEQLLAEANEREIEVGDMYQRKIAFGRGDIQKSYKSFRGHGLARVLRSYLGNRYVQNVAELPNDPDCKVGVIAYFGPGDEIRFASVYERLRRLIPQSELHITCDPRLQVLFERSFTNMNFCGTKRLRSLAWTAEIEDYRTLPGSDLHSLVDNRGWALVQQCDRVTLSTDPLGDLLEGYESFSGDAYLRADAAQVAYWRGRLANVRGRRLVGLSWRSSLTTYSRNEHYVSVEHLLPLLQIEDVQFVNLQYDDCREELAWIDERFPGKVINFEDLDQYNDLDNVAALMQALDLIIAPATTVIELAGALGCPALLLSNSSELHWRKRPGSMVDVWHRSVRHVEGVTLGDKGSLMNATASILRQWLEDQASMQRHKRDTQEVAAVAGLL